MDKSTALKNHIAFKKTSVKSNGKIQDIERYLKMFLNSTKHPLEKFDENDMVRFLNSLNYSIGTINGIKFYIKNFVKWFYPDWSARFRNLDKICKTQKAPRAYEPEDMISFEDFEKLVKAENNLQWKVYWLTMFYGGFRPSEACRLKWEQVFFEPQGVIIKIRTTKTGKYFYKSLPETAEQLLRELKANSDSPYLFPSPIKENTSIIARTVCARLKKLSSSVLGKEVVPYALRHSIATILYSDDTRKDEDTANQLGHTKNMKEVYMNLNEEQIKSKARKLWVNTDLSPKEKHRLEEEIEKMKETFEKESAKRKKFDMILNKISENPKLMEMIGVQ